MAPIVTTPFNVGRMAVMAMVLALVSGCGGGGGGDTGTTSTTTPAAGDADNVYPLNVGDRWVYKQTHTGEADTLKIAEVTTVESQQGESVYTLQGRDAVTSADQSTLRQSKTTQGVYEIFTAPNLYLGESRLQGLKFPLTVGSTFTSIDKTGYEIDDFDGDGKPELLDLKVVITVEARESITVPAGTFSDTVRVRTQRNETYHLSATGSVGNSSYTYTDWYAPGVGRVRNSETATFPNATYNYVDELSLMAYSVGGKQSSGLKPKATSTLPANGATLTSDAWSGAITVTFDQAIDGSSLGAGLQLTDDTGKVYAGGTYPDTSSTYRLVPQQALPPGHYTVSLTSGSDLVGQPIAPLPTWSFTIVAATVPPPPDTTPPQVEYTFPTNGATAVYGTTVTFSFNEDIKPATVTAQNFLVSENGVALDASKVTVTTESARTVRLTFPTNYSMPYTVKALAGITDTVGNTLVPVTLAFTVADAPPQPVTFYPARNYSPDTIPTTMSMGDVYGAGKNALVMALGAPMSNIMDTTTPRQILIYPQTSDGTPIGNPLTASFGIDPTCTTYISQVLIGDVTGDGRPDIVATDYWCKKLHIFEQTATNTWTQTSTIAWPYQMTARLVDLNNDGRLDLVSVDGASHTVFLWYQQSAGGFSTPVSIKVPMPDDFPTNPAFKSVNIGDINGDGRPDIVLVDTTSLTAKSVMTLAQRADGTFSTTPSYLPASSSSPKNVAIGDINGDGRADVVVTGDDFYTGFVAIYTQDSSGQLGQPQLRSGGGAINQVDIVDMNGDGRKDVVVTRRTSGIGSVGVMLQRRDGSLTEEESTSVSSAPMNAVVIGNLNGDLLPDVALMNYGFFQTMSQPLASATSAQASATGGRRAFMNRAWLRERLLTSPRR